MDDYGGESQSVRDLTPRHGQLGREDPGGVEGVLEHIAVAEAGQEGVGQSEGGD